MVVLFIEATQVRDKLYRVFDSPIYLCVLSHGIQKTYTHSSK